MTDASTLAETAAPHSITAERAVLGAILCENEIWHRVSEFLLAEHFYDPVHGRLYATVSEYVGAGRLADAITLASLAEADTGLKALGGVAYLDDLMAAGAGVSSTAARDYGRHIYDLALRRALIRTGSEIETDARVEQDAAPRELLERAERKLFDLAETGRANRGFVNFSTALAHSIEMASAAYEREGGLSGLSTGLRDLDQQLGGLHPSDLLILAGRPSMGKTSLATNIAFHIARRYRAGKDARGATIAEDGGVVGFFSLEMSSEQLATRLLSEYSGIPSHFIRRGEIEAHQFEHIRDAAAEIAHAPLHIDDTGGISISALSARARRLKRTVGLDFIVVDYLQLVTGGSKNKDNRVQEVSEVTQGLKALAKELNVPVLALSQLSRQVENRDDKRPQLSDLRESGSIEQDADVVMFVYREEYYVARSEPKSKEGTDEYAAWQETLNAVKGKAEVIVGKQRHGPIGIVEVAFDERLTKFYDLDQGRYQDAARGRPGGGPAIGPGL